MGRFSSAQKAGVEKVTGRGWNSYHPEALRAYFAYTDRGNRILVSQETQSDLEYLLSCHKFHPAIVEMWKVDFKCGLLWLDDFMDPSLPINYLRHVIEIYVGVMKFIPSRYEAWLSSRGIR